MLTLYLEKGILRCIQLAKLITSENRWFTISELVQKLGGSNQTIRKDISFIKEVLPPNWELTCQKGRGIQLTKPTSSSNNELCCLLYRRSVAFEIFEELLQGNVKAVCHLTEKLFLQPRSVYSHLKKIQKHIQLYGLHLETKPLRIVGNEAQILLMFYDLYLHAYSDNEWPFTEIQQEVILQYIRHFENLAGVNFHQSSRRKLSFYLTIFFKRKLQGHVVELETCKIDAYVNTSIYQKVSLIGEKLSNELNISLTIDDTVLITIAINASRFTFKDINLAKQTFLQYFKEGKIASYQYAKDFIIMLEQETRQHLTDNEEFIFDICNYLRRIPYRFQRLSMIKRPEKITTKYIKEKYGVTFEQVKIAFDTFVKKYGLASNAYEEEVAKVTLRIEASNMLASTAHKKALLVIAEGDSWKAYIRAALVQRFGGKLQCVQKDINDFTKDELVTMGIDLIITTTPLEIEGISTICINPIISQSDIDNIRDFIDDCS
ncbi:helix-turn-helix domain-containing protein [Brevibacillus laterosporus]|uniref:BglG family transcription antiterminator n=1 Tax=Brevibacillus laterosporus TaxID=1465 RepID=UPI0003636DA4|nr:helix-turn-helix domain-containing protein [Brevibacillus laterosporus]ATO51554.1 capsule biosynthesis protein [Brevibacillus laterosporus DSM 25]MBG9805072.1 capsule biosynthesis protein [Brevibacillus laterosporus]MED2004418.1 helix-turn-helix domain-containing protein [Brevibacillus laterosporus]MED4764047.1 helix-turn-helix domain-containing protein [Brevibacillus laterosporus]TPH13693.1 HTH domain-containing protein [Brevibacillus laterosporus]